MTYAFDNFGGYSEKKTTIIELDSTSYLVVKQAEDEYLGDVVQIKQLFKRDGKIKEGGTINLPINDLGISGIQRLEDLYGEILLKYRPEEKFEQWIKRGKATPQKRERGGQEVKVAALSADVFKERIQEEISTDRLREQIPNCPFVIEDVIYAIINNQPFAEPIKINIDQMKVVMYHGLMGGRDLITTRVSDYLLKLNIEYEFRKTGMILKSFADAGLVKYEDFVTRNKYNARKWLFSQYTHEKVSEENEEEKG